MNVVQSEAIILKQKPFNDKDRLVTFLARDKGVMTGVAKGAKVLTNRGVGSFEPFTHGMVFYLDKPSSGLVTIRKCDVLPPYRLVGQKYDHFLYASYCAEWVAICPIQEGDAEPLFQLLLATLERLAQAPAGRLPLERLAFELDFLDCLGLAPRWGRCAVCHQPLYSRSDQGWRLLFSAPHQYDVDKGVRCPQCRGAGPNLYPLSAQALAFFGPWRDPQGEPPPMPGREVLAELEAAVTAQLFYSLEKRPRSLSLLPPLEQI